MKKYSYKMIKRDNESLWKQLGLKDNNTKPVEIHFANILGLQGYEMFQVVQYKTQSCYFFKKEIN